MTSDLQQISLAALDDPSAAPSWPLSRRRRTVVLGQDTVGDQAAVALLSQGRSGQGAVHLFQYTCTDDGWSLTSGSGSDPAPDSLGPRRPFPEPPVDILAISGISTTDDEDQQPTTQDATLGFVLLRASAGVTALRVADRTHEVPDHGHVLLLVSQQDAPPVGTAFDAVGDLLGTFDFS